MALSDKGGKYLDPSPQKRGKVCGWILLISLVTTFISPKSSAVTCPVVVFSLLVAASDARGLGEVLDYVRRPIIRSLTAFFAFCALSWFWSTASAHGILTLAFNAFLISAAATAVYALKSETDGNLVRVAEGLWIGFLIGLTYLCFDLVSKGAIKLDQIKSIMLISPLETARSITPVTLLLGPALLTVVYSLRGRIRDLIVAFIFGLSVLTVFISPHETSKMAMVLWAITFAFTRRSPMWTERGLIAVWTVLCIFIVPLSLGAYHLNFHKADLFQPSAQARIAIWNEYSKRVLSAPVFGAGYDMSSVTRPEVPDVTEQIVRVNKIPASKVRPFLANHPHNVYVQVWYELGGFGALLFFVTGLCVVRLISSLEEHQKPYIFATFASGVMILLSSYGMWQSWFVATFVYSLVAAGIAVEFTTSRRLDGLAE